VKNKKVLHGVKKDRNILHTMKRMQANWIGHILHRNCLPKNSIQGKVDGSDRKMRNCKQLLDDLKETRGYWKLK
jgi:hypothetical protein